MTTLRKAAELALEADAVIDMARQAGIGVVYGTESILRFAAAVADAERVRICAELRETLRC